MIAMINYYLSGDYILGNLPVGATYLNHGYMYSYYQYEQYASGQSFYKYGMDYPPMITIIDLGQGIFIFLVGFLASYSFTKRKTIMSSRNALEHAISRTLILFGISVVLYEIILDWGWYEVFFNSVVSNIAWATLMASLVTHFIKKGKHRCFVGYGVMLIHTILYSFENIRTWEVYVGENYEYFTFPWLTLNLIAVSLIASGIQEWIFDENGKVDEKNGMRRALKASFFFFIAGYFLDFIQWADQQRCTSAFVCIIIGFGLFTLYLSYAITTHLNIEIKILVLLGKNMFVMFFLAPAIGIILPSLISEIVYANKFAALLLVGLLPHIIILSIAYILDKNNIILKI